MWGSSSTVCSRTPAAPMLGREKATTSSARVPLQPDECWAEEGGRRTREEEKRSKEAGKKHRSGCLCCRGQPKPRGEGGGNHKKNKNKQVPGENMTSNYPNSTNKRATLESGISCLSQFSDIPRFDADTDTMVTGSAPLPPKPVCSRRQAARAKCCSLARKFVQVFFSFLGLTILLAGYTTGGAFLFVYLEKDHELRVSRDLLKLREDFVNGLWNTTDELNVFQVDGDSWKEIAAEALKKFQREIHQLTLDGWTGVDDVFNPPPSTWNFYTSFLYTTTVITTIGYGNVTPKTQLARLITVVYAVIGIPLCLVWLSALGSYMATGLCFLYQHLCRFFAWLCCGCDCCRRRNARWRRRGAPPPSSKLEERGAGASDCRQEKRGKGTGKLTVPWYICLLLIFLYLMLGAWLFSMWEGWDLGDAGYFCFITLSTIGFGDFVPGFDTFDNTKAICTALYLIIGLALLAMCFKLMQDDVTKSLRGIMDSIQSWSDGPKIKVRDGKLYVSPCFESHPKIHEDFEVVHEDKLTKEDRSKLTKKARKEEEKLSKEEKRKVAKELKLARKTEKNAVKNKNSKARSLSPSSTAVDTKTTTELPRYTQTPGRKSVSGEAHHDFARLATESDPQLSPKRPMSKEFQSMRALTVCTSDNDEFDTNTFPPRARVHTISGSMAAQERYGDGGTACSKTLPNNNRNNMANMNSSAGPPGPMVPRPTSCAPQSLADTVDLLEHMSWMRENGGSSGISPKMTRRDRSRSPVRGRPKSRGAGSEDKGGNVDVATEDEEEEEEEDDDTIDAASVASSTDLVKVAQAIRRERSQKTSPTSPHSPSPFSPSTTLSQDSLPAFAHPHNNAAMSTFRPPPTGGNSSKYLSPHPSTRPVSRCQSRARSSSPESTSYFQYDAASSRPSSAGVEEEGSVFSEEEEEGEEGSTVGSPDADLLLRSAFSKPRPPSSLAGRSSEDSYGYASHGPNQQQYQQHVQQQRQQAQQQQQKQRQQPQQKHVNKVYSSDNVMPPRCVSPKPKAPKTPQHKVGPPAPPAVHDKRVAPPTMPKTKKLITPQAF